MKMSRSQVKHGKVNVRFKCLGPVTTSRQGITPPKPPFGASKD